MEKILLLISLVFLLQPGFSQEKSRSLQVRYEERMYCEDSCFVFELDVILENSQDSSYFYYYWDHKNYQAEKSGNTTHIYIRGYSFGPNFYEGGFIKKKTKSWTNLEFAGLDYYCSNRIFEDLLKVELVPKSTLIIHFKRLSLGVKRPWSVKLFLDIESSYFTHDIAETRKAFKSYDINDIIYSPVRREIRYIRKIPLRKVNRCK